MTGGGEQDVGVSGMETTGGVTISPQLPQRHILWGGGQKGPRGDQAITIPEAPRHLGRYENFLLIEILSGTEDVTSVLSWLFSAVRA